MILNYYKLLAIPLARNAPDYVKKYAQLTIPVKGGKGAFRAFVEKLLKENQLFDKALELYLNK